MALSFYPRIKHSTKVSERHAMLICEKSRVGNLEKCFGKAGLKMELILCMIIGIIIGIVFGRQVFRRDVVGSLRVDQSDPDSGPYLFLELSHKGADAIYKKRYVVLKVNIKIIFRMNNKSFYGTVNEFTKGELKWVKTSKNC